MTIVYFQHTVYALIYLNIPSVWAPCNLSTSSDNVDWTHGSFRCGKRSFCKAITSRSVLPNILGRKICSCNAMQRSTLDKQLTRLFQHSYWTVHSKKYNLQILSKLHTRRHMQHFQNKYITWKGLKASAMLLL